MVKHHSKPEGKSKYGSVDDEENDTDGDDHAVSTPKISHINRAKRALAQQQQRRTSGRAETAASDRGILTHHESFPGQQLKDHFLLNEEANWILPQDDDQESLVSFGTAATPPGSPKQQQHRVLLSFGGSFRRRHHRSSWLNHSSSSGWSSNRTWSSSLQSLVGDSVRTAVDVAFRLPGKACDVREGQGTATLASEVFNLVKNLVGAGALGLPSGVAAFANQPSSSVVLTTALVVVIMGTVFAYYFWLVGRLCQWTGTASYREAWEVTMISSKEDDDDDHANDDNDDDDDVEVDGGSAALVALFTTLMAGLGNLAYSMILGSVTRSLVLTATGVELPRSLCVVLVTLTALWPLCTIKRLHTLASFSLLGMAGMLFTVGSMFWRWYDGSYAYPGGRFVDDLSNDLKPAFGTVGASGALSLNLLILICMNYQSWFCHYNAPRFYIELRNNTVGRFGAVVGVSFGIAAAVYIAMAGFGFATFGAHCDGFILDNYSNRDVLANLCRICIAVALVFTYPLPFIGCRDGILDLLMVPVAKRTSQNLNVLTVMMLIVITLLAMHFEDLGRVNAVGGALFGTAVVFIFPALMFRRLAVRLERQCESRVAMSLMYLGIALGATGVVVAITGSKFNDDSSSDDLTAST